MAIESTTDRDYFFDTGDFGTVATFTDPAIGSVNGIFDEENEIEEETMTVITRVSFLAKEGDLTGVIRGSALSIGGTNYQVKVRLDDGTGVTELLLKRA